jgi:DNA-binding transcriptional regulator YhcF (GntR family)
MFDSEELVDRAVYKRPAMAKRPPATAPMTGRPVAAAAPADSVPEAVASLAMELAAEERLAASDPEAVPRAEEMLERAELAEAAAEESVMVADEAAEPRLEVTEEASEARLEVRELIAEPMSVGTMSETIEETTSWALTTPTAKTVVAMVEKRILRIGWVGWGWLGEVKLKEWYVVEVDCLWCGMDG